jgi:hypothetical protein
MIDRWYRQSGCITDGMINSTDWLTDLPTWKDEPNNIFLVTVTVIRLPVSWNPSAKQKTATELYSMLRLYLPEIRSWCFLSPSCHVPLAFCRSVIVGFCALGSLMLLGPPAARADSPDAGALWLWTRRLSNVDVIVEEATDLSLVGDWRVDPTLRMLSSRDCCCCHGGNIDEKVVVVVDSCASGDVVTAGCKSWN